MTVHCAIIVRFTNGFTEAPADSDPAPCELLPGRGSRPRAQQLAIEYPDAFFLLPDGISYHGHAVSGGKKKGSGPLALKRELRECDPGKLPRKNGR